MRRIEQKSRGRRNEEQTNGVKDMEKRRVIRLKMRGGRVREKYVIEKEKKKERIFCVK
jgi:hypothetical protein